MDNWASSETLGLIALLLNALTLAIVAYQTWLTRGALVASQTSADLERKTRQLEGLGDAGYITGVLAALERWQEILQDVLDSLLEARKGDLHSLNHAASKGQDSPKGLIDKPRYDSAPRWLVEIWVAGAQHYYSCMAATRYLWDFDKGEPRVGIERDFGVDDMLVYRFEDSIRYIGDLIGLIRDGVPEAYLQAPASLSEDRFLDR